MKNKLVLILSVFIIALSVLVVGCGGQVTEEQTASNEKTIINIGKSPYVCDWVPVHILKHVAEEMGYSAKFVEGDIGFIWLGLAQGDIDIYPSCWLPTLHKTYMEKYKEKIELVGTLYEQADMGLAVPSYVGIDTIADLKDRSAEFDNRIVGIEPSAGIMLTTEKTIEVYGLDDYELIVGSTPAMLAAVDEATKTKSPIIFTAWRPDTMFTKYDIKLLKDTKGIWEFDDVYKGVYLEFKEKAPDFYEFAQNFKITKDEIEQIMLEIDKGGDVEQLTKEWIENNRERVDQMIGK